MNINHNFNYNFDMPKPPDPLKAASKAQKHFEQRFPQAERIRKIFGIPPLAEFLD